MTALDFAWLRLYCALVPRPYRRSHLRHTLGWGPIGAVIWAFHVPGWPIAERMVAKMVAKNATADRSTHE